MCILWVGVSKGMYLYVKHQPIKILMAINYCGCQLPQKLGWAALAYNKKEGATPHPEAHKHSFLSVCLMGALGCSLGRVI